MSTVRILRAHHRTLMRLNALLLVNLADVYIPVLVFFGSAPFPIPLR